MKGTLMRTLDAGTTMSVGAAIGSIIGVLHGNINLSVAIGAAAGAMIGGIFMMKNKLNHNDKH